MVEVSNTARRVRKKILDSFVDTGRAPNLGEIMVGLGLTRPEAVEAFREIATIDTFSAEKGTENIRILSPFANVSTPYKVTIDGIQKWHAVCGIEALGVWVFFPGKVVQVDTYCRDCGEVMLLKLRDGQVIEQSPDRIVAHLGVPVARWFDDLIYA
ncbi:MAG TPA: organomercurial lyase [Candidatus Methylomirabilis sp.]|nr:organomercurial lyase [Candidatus Methylomirabilis sp.]